MRGSFGAMQLGGFEEFARSNPELFGVLALLAVLLAAAAGWAVLYLRRPAGERFRRAISELDEIAVLTHPNPDPDAMACAMAVKRLAASVGVDARIHYPGQIRHQENRAFRTVLAFEGERLEGTADIDADEVVLVDHNVPRGFPGAEGVEPVAVVDHHPGNGVGTSFTDVRPDRGSCASILAEYFRDLDAERLGPDDEVPEGDELVLDDQLATALLFGIQSDTKRLTNGCTDADFDACAYLYPAIDGDLLERIANPQVSAETLEVKADAITRREVDGSFAVSHVGELTDADAIPQAADELVRLEGVSAVVVMGERDDVMHLSGRSRDDRVHMGEALEAAVEDVPMASAGGHARMGGAQVSIEHMQGIGPSDGISIEEFKARIFECLRGDV